MSDPENSPPSPGTPRRVKRVTADNDNRLYVVQLVDVGLDGAEVADSEQIRVVPFALAHPLVDDDMRGATLAIVQMVKLNTERAQAVLQVHQEKAEKA